MNSLSLREVRLERREPRTFMEFVVDGRDLREILAPDYAGFNIATDVVSAFVLNWPIGFPREDFDRIAGAADPPLPLGRTPLYICAECGDLGCGAVTLVIDLQHDRVVWHEFGYENGYEDFDQDSVFPGVGPFVFARGNYEAVLSEFHRRWPTPDEM